MYLFLICQLSYYVLWRHKSVILNQYYVFRHVFFNPIPLEGGGGGGGGTFDARANFEQLAI